MPKGYARYLLTHALDLAPKNPKDLRVFGRIRENMGDFCEIIHKYEEKLKFFSKNPDFSGFFAKTYCN